MTKGVQLHRVIKTLQKPLHKSCSVQSTHEYKYMCYNNNTREHVKSLFWHSPASTAGYAVPISLKCVYCN